MGAERCAAAPVLMVGCRSPLCGCGRWDAGCCCHTAVMSTEVAVVWGWGGWAAGRTRQDGALENRKCPERGLGCW